MDGFQKCFAHQKEQSAFFYLPSHKISSEFLVLKSDQEKKKKLFCFFCSSFLSLHLIKKKKESVPKPKTNLSSMMYKKLLYLFDDFLQSHFLFQSFFRL